MVNIQRIKKEGIAGKRYVFFRDGKTKYAIPNKYGKMWWKKATISDIRRVAIRVRRVVVR